jgi:hypothetical protein
MSVTVRLGNIAALDVDVVVVSANTTLDLEGGGARALAEACGPDLLRELEAARARGPVRVPDVIVTGAGAHPHVRRVLWAVIRDDADDALDDVVAVEGALTAVWRILATAKRQARVGIVPLGAVEIGASTSASLIARTLEAAQLPAGHVDVSIVTTKNDDVAAMQRAIVPVLKARSKQAVVGDAVIETFDRWGVGVPVGCAGVLLRVRRRGVISDPAIDGQRQRR